MEIHFFEEYPSETTLAPAALVSFPAMVFLATATPCAFERAAAQLRAASPILTPAWWPVPAESRAISVFSSPMELNAITTMLETVRPQPILLDLELPLWEPRRLITSCGRIRVAGRAADRLFATALRRHEVWTAEYPPALPGRLLRWMRLVLPRASTRTYMAYSSMLPAWWRSLLLRRLRPRFASRRGAIGIGALAVGVAGNEPLLSPARLAADLREARDTGVAAAVIYRLGGLTPDHAAVVAESTAGNSSGFAPPSTLSATAHRQG